VRLRDVMTPDPECCLPDTPLREVGDMFVRRDCGAIPVLDKPGSRRPVGIVTDRDIVVKVVADGKTVENATARDAMTNNPVTCREDDDVSQAVPRMAERKERRLPIVDGSGTLRGIISQADIATRVLRDTTTGELVEAISEPGTVRK
jgi:CBS domain-containing protein